ncbi:hypothetical protein ACJQ6O_003396 [Yersinia enterocolitica]
MDKFITIVEASKSSGISENDIIRIALNGEISLCANFDLVSSDADFIMELTGSKIEVLGWLNTMSTELNGEKHLNSNSRFILRNVNSYNFFDLNFNGDDTDDDLTLPNGYEFGHVVKPNQDIVLTASVRLTGVWRLNNSFLKKCIILGRCPNVSDVNLKPFGNYDTSHYLRISNVNYRSGVDIDILYLSHDDFNKIYNNQLDQQTTKSIRIKNYTSQSAAQIERHSAKRLSILMAAISLYKRFPNECSKNPSRWGNLLWEKRYEYWSEDDKTPLSKDEIVKLLRKAVKAPFEPPND